MRQTTSITWFALCFLVAGCASGDSPTTSQQPGDFLAQPVTALACVGSNSVWYLRVLRHPAKEMYFVREELFVGETAKRPGRVLNPNAYEGIKVGDVVSYGKKRSEKYTGMVKHVLEEWKEIDVRTGKLTFVTMEDGVNKNPSSSGIQCDYTPEYMQPQSLNMVGS